MKNKNTWLYPTFGSILIGAIFPILAANTLKNAPPFLTLTLTFITAAIVLWIMIILQKKTWELQNKKAWKYGLLTGVLNGACFYGFYYVWLLSTSPWNAALVAQTEVFFAFLYFQAWRKESLSKEHISGIIFLIVWVVYLLLPRTSGWNYGDILILIGMMFAPLGNFYQKTGRTHVSSETFLFIRYICTIPLTALLSYISSENMHWVMIDSVIWQIILMGVIVFVVKNILWVEAIKTVTITRILALHGCMPFLTLLIIWSFQGLSPTATQLTSWIPILIGVILLSRK